MNETLIKLLLKNLGVNADDIKAQMEAAAAEWKARGEQLDRIESLLIREKGH